MQHCPNASQIYTAAVFVSSDELLAPCMVPPDSKPQHFVICLHNAGTVKL